MSLPAEIWRNLTPFVSDKNARIAVSAIVIAALATGVLAFIFGFKYVGGAITFSINNEHAIGFGLIFIILFISVWFILYVTGTNDANDVYSEVRENLQGLWLVTYQAKRGAELETTTPIHAVGCKIEINALKKLELVFNISSNPIFVNDDSRIRDVAIRYSENGGYTMFYYYKVSRQLHAPIARHLLPEDDSPNIGQVELEIFGHLRFDKPAPDETVKKITGRWYDLNGNSSRLITFVEQTQSADAKGEAFTPIQLSKVSIGTNSLDADMGTVEFSR